MKQSDIDLNYVIELSKQGFTQTEVASKIGCVYQDIQRLLKNSEHKITWNKNHKIKKDEFFFETIDSEIKAYLLGFLYADGNIDKTQGRITLCIQEDDIYVANLFKDFIAPGSFMKIIHNTAGAKNRKPQVFLRINSIKIVNDLKNHGLCPRKTYETLNFPSIPENMYSHFIRGYFDGDGCVMKSASKKDVYYNKVIFCINWKPFLDKMCEIFYSIGIDSIFTKKMKGKTVDWYNLCLWSQENNALFANFIYNDANYYLERKKSKFLFQNTEVTIEPKISIAP